MTGCRVLRLLVACGILLTCVSAEAQEARQDRRFGLTVGYPSSGGLIGLVWQTSDRMAFRPEVSFAARFAGENTTGDSTTVGVTVTVLRYVARKDNVSAYVGPRLSYSRATGSGGTTETTSSSYGAGATVGLQYELTRRIGVYGELGAGYSFARSTSTGINPSLTTSSHVITSRSSVGLNLYF